LQVAPPVATTAPSFSVEVSTLDQARAAIADREPARALAILDEYAARFPRGVMGPESSVLRIEALLGAGDRTAAERVAHAFLLNNPASPYEQRIQSLLMSNP
jgi:outer membrane protein assembly factor BamD (BamD/ComL family)